MTRVWTHGVWTIRAGREDDFVAAWTELVPLGRGLGSGDPLLLRDRDRASTFRSFGSWPDLETVERFREELGSRPGMFESIVDGLETFTLDEVYPGD
ncbi:MAG TPA: hypothetical protein VMK83_01430 [Gaiellaceae bacterium]|nr:hypothetical protein [Gaiellaceae bacterium]